VLLWYLVAVIDGLVFIDGWVLNAFVAVKLFFWSIVVLCFMCVFVVGWCMVVVSGVVSGFRFGGSCLVSVVGMLMLL